MTQDYTKELQEHNRFINDTVREKYLQEGETSYNDIKHRMIASLPDNRYKPSIAKCINEERLVPAGSILAALGVPDNQDSLSNCYYIPIEEDSIEGIYDANKRMARIFSKRGGCGVDITILRPKGAKVNNSAKVSSGAVSFVPLFAKTGSTIGQNGRRAAMLISIDIRHPDVLDFINMKWKPGEVFAANSFGSGESSDDLMSVNVSVKIPDSFFNTLKTDGTWELYFPDINNNPTKYKEEWDGNYDNWGGNVLTYQVIKAKELYSLICEASYNTGDPGALFIDRIKSAPASILDTKLVPTGCNPCGEQPLAPWQNCLLSAMVLYKYVVNPYEANAKFNWTLFHDEVVYGIIFLNMISKLNEARHPLQQQCDMDMYSRRVGLEMTGIADTLAMLGMQYGSKDSLVFLDGLMKFKALFELGGSSLSTNLVGVAPALADPAKFYSFVNTEYITNIVGNGVTGNKVHDYILNNKLANTAFNTLGPCGSISIVAGNCTSGIEPLYAAKYNRRTKFGTYDLVHGPALIHSIEHNVKYEDIISKYKTAHDIGWEDRIAVQSTLQKYTDSGVSSTVNLPNSATQEDIRSIFIKAWEGGLKGITIFRDECKAGVLTTKSSNHNKVATKLDQIQFVEKELLSIEQAERHKVAYKNGKLYVIVSVDDEVPVEIFCKLPREVGLNRDGFFEQERLNETTANWDALSRLTSKLLRYGAPIEDLIKQLDKSSFSMVDAPGVIARILKRYINTSDAVELCTTDGAGLKCPECGENEVYREAGCKHCKKCSYSSCD